MHITSLLSLLAPVQEAERVNLLSPAGGLMFWTLLVFIVLIFVLGRYAYKPLLAAVEAREEALQRALDQAQHDREAAAKLLEEHQRQLESARGEAQRLIADGRATSEKMKAEMLEVTRAQQQELLERAKREIESEKARAITELRREAVDLAIAAASKVIEKDLDSGANRQLVESFLSSIPAQAKR
ncbi:MAG TPA: F0F1 ATP synthase subunit B [Gemmatimonadaceae bacterium]|nr:F0F1 ATP synthase subunit B [Gemmatimonadaceae bacterium]